MRWTHNLIPTLRDDPQEAEIPSHKLMLRAGLIRRLAGGLYTFLPLGMRSLHKVERIIREEMEAAGALEILMPALQPREAWDTSERYDVMGDVMFKVLDRQKKQLVLGPTHEEIITMLVSREIRSYRDVPKNLYQIQTKFRDEIRPRFGLMRAKEFIMKDAYSFDLDWDAADISYRKMYDAYTRIFERCGLRTHVVEAETGAMGGRSSHEFMVVADAGEDGLVECPSCAYAANVERAERAFRDDPAVFEDAEKSPEEVETPNSRTIDEVSAFLHCEARQLVKTLLYTIGGKDMAFLVPGDRDINENKILHALEATDITLCDEPSIRKITGAPVGFAGPVGLTIPVYADLSLKGCAGVITGANAADKHLLHVNLDRDAAVTGYLDLCIVRDRDACPRCDGTLKEKRGIEVGHVFKLGTKYTETFGATFLDDAGKTHPLVMGCYGIGVTRTLQAVIEQCHDDAGIMWPIHVSPYAVDILVLDPDHPDIMKAAEELAANLEKSNVDCILDDREERPGVKFKDADLVGFPIRVVVSRRSMEKSMVELKLRDSKESVLLPPDKAEESIRALYEKTA